MPKRKLPYELTICHVLYLQFEMNTRMTLQLNSLMWYNLL